MAARKKNLVDTDPNPEPIDYIELGRGLELLLEHPDTPVATDTETTGLDVFTTDNAIGVSYAGLVGGEAISGYVAYDHVVGQNAPHDIQQMTCLMLEQTGRPLIFQGAQFDWAALNSIGIDVVDHETYDLPVMVNLIDENMPMKTMAAIAKKFTPHVEKLEDDDWLNDQKVTGWPLTTPERMWKYAVNDAVVTFLGWDALIQHRQWLDTHPSVWESRQAEMRTLYYMRQRGVLHYREVSEHMAKVGRAKMAEITEEVGGVNLGSGKVLNELLIEQLGLPIVKRSAKTQAPSFDKEAMEQYEAMLENIDNPLAQQILAYRGWQKATSAGYDSYLKHEDVDGRIRTEYTLHVTRTGRLSSRDPNLQQIPKESDRLKKPWNWQVKACFIAPPGFAMWGVDYSQLELRLLAGFAGIESLKKVFLEGRDLFTEMAEALGYPRQMIKTMVYANNYGAGAAKIAQQLGITVSQAKAMLRDYHSTYPEMRIFSNKLEQMAKRGKRIPIWSGRWRHMPYPNDSYKAMNSFIQGGAADIVGRAMVKLFEEVEDENCHMVMQIHDAFGFEIREGFEDEYLTRIEAIMTDVDGLIAHRFPEGLGTKFDVEAERWPVYEPEYGFGLGPCGADGLHDLVTMYEDD